MDENLDLDLEENESEIKKIIEYINEADGTPTESTMGWYGGAYAVTIVKTNGEEYYFSLFRSLLDALHFGNLIS